MKMKNRLKLGKMKINVQLAEKYNECNPDFEIDAESNEEWKGPEKKTASSFDNTDVFDFAKEAICIQDNLYIANAAAACDPDVLRTFGITHVINLTAHTINNEIELITYLNLSLNDTPDSDITTWIPQVIDFISKEERTNKDSKFMFHCRKGISRSVALMAGYLMYRNSIGLKSALEIIKAKRPEMDPNIGFLGQLQMWEEQLAARKDTFDIDLEEFKEWINDVELWTNENF